MGFRDDELAGQERAHVLEQEVARLKAENAALQAPAPRPPRERPAPKSLMPIAAIALLAAVGAAVAPLPAVGRIVLSVAALLALNAALIVFLLSRMLYVVRPGEVLVLSGRSTVGPDGQQRGYRVVTGGRALRIPVLESAERMDLGPFPFSLDLRNLYARGGPIDLRASAAIELSSDPRLLPNAVERFLGRSNEEAVEVARQTLEGALRTVMAELDLQMIQADIARVTSAVRKEVAYDLEKLGFELESFVIESAAPAH